MKIHLAKSGGQKEGPFTVEQINQGIAVGVIQDIEYWAWHEGLPEWLPLHRVLRQLAVAGSAAPAAVAPEQKPALASNRSDISSAKVATAGASADCRHAGTNQQGDESRSTQPISEADSFTDVFEVAPKPVAETAPVASSPTLVVAKSAAIAAPDYNPKPKSSLTAESDVVTALVQAATQPEREANPIARAAGSQPVPQNKAAQPEPAASPAYSGAASPLAMVETPSSDRMAAPAESLEVTPPSQQPSPLVTDHASPNQMNPVFVRGADKNNNPMQVGSRIPEPNKTDICSGSRQEQQSNIGRLTDAAAPSADKQLASGLPFAALERMFFFSTGGKQSIWDSPKAAQMLQDIIGEHPNAIRLNVPRDVIFNCNVGGLLGVDGDLSESVWQAMAVRQPELIQRQRKGAHQVCTRSFRIESGAIVVLVLFYDNAKLGSATA